MPLISVVVVGAYALDVPIVFTDGDGLIESDLDDDTTYALATALACNITLNGVPVCGEPSDLAGWWLAGTDVQFGALR